MTRTSRLVLAGVSSGALIVGWTCPALAQSDTDIIVTARRVEERLQEVPISISVVSQQQIAERNITNSAQLAEYVPSLSTDNRYGGGDTTTFNIRGFFQEGSTTPTVGVYFADAIALRGNTAANTSSGDGVGSGSLFDLQNIQVLKGPQGTLFGRNTTGGTILLVPTKPTSRFEGYIEGSIGNYGMDRQQAVLNVPLSEGARLRLGFDRMQRDGWQNNVSGLGPSKMGSTNYYAFRGSLVLDLTPNLENYTVASFSNSDAIPAVNKIVACNPTGGGLGAAIVPFGLCDAHLARNGTDFYNVQNALQGPVTSFTRQWQVVNTTTWRASDDLTIKNILAYGQFKSRFRNNVFGENFILDPATATTPGARAIATALQGARFITGISSFSPETNAADQDTLSEELQFQGELLEGKLNWQGGLYLERSSPLKETTSQSGQVLACRDSSFTPVCTDYLRAVFADAFGFPFAFIPASAATLRNSTKVYYRNYGIYGQGTYAFSDHVKVTAGLRYSWDEMSGYSNLRNLFFPGDRTFAPPGVTTGVPGEIPRACLFGAQLTSLARDCFVPARKATQKPTWLIDIEWLPTKDLLFYAKYARGYRQGGIQIRSPIQTYDAETIDAYEVGTKVSFRNGDISGTFNLNGFYNKLKNQQLQTSFQITGGNYTSLINVGKARVYGLELDTNLRFFERLRLDVGAAYLNSNVESVPSVTAIKALVDAATGQNSTINSFPLSNEPLPLAPEWRLVVTPGVDLPVPDGWGKVTASATVIYTSQSFTTSPAFPRNLGYDSPKADLNYNDPTTVVNANIGWQSVGGAPVDLSLFATNVLKAKYYNGYLGGYQSVGMQPAIQGLPRMFGARLRFRFGALGN